NRVVLIVLDARDLAVASRGDLDALDRSVGRGVRPRVLLAVHLAGEADLLELLIRSVILPPVDCAVLVLVYFDSHHSRAVHVAPRIDDAVPIRVIFEETELSGFLIVLSSYTLGVRFAASPITGRNKH